MKNKEKFWLIASQWMIFSAIMAILALVFLLKDRKEIISKYETCQNNWELAEKQFGSGRVILELTKSNEGTQ